MAWPEPGPEPSQYAHAQPARGDVIFRSDYVPPERERERFGLASDGMPTGYLALRARQLVVLADGAPEEMVNSRSAQAYQLGVFMFRLRGGAHYESALRAGDFTPGAPVRLVREPENGFDAHAIAVYAADAREPSGYVNRQNAARLAKLIDAGEGLSAIAMQGAGPGEAGATPVILVARTEVVAHLMRNL